MKQSTHWCFQLMLIFSLLVSNQDEYARIGCSWFSLALSPRWFCKLKLCTWTDSDVNSFLEGCVMQKGQDDGLRCTLKLSENHYQKAEYCVPLLSSLAEFMCPYGGLTLQKTYTCQSSASQLSSTRGGCMVKFVTSRESSSCFPWLSLRLCYC